METVPPVDGRKRKSVLDCCQKCGKFAAPKGGLCDHCFDAEHSEKENAEDR